VTSANASYFSSGWVPGQTPTTTAQVAQPTETAQTTTASPSLDWQALIEKGPINKIFKWAGINVTEQLAAARERAAKLPWDERIQMITDDNYDHLIKNEDLDWDEEKKRVWFMVVTHSKAQDPLSIFFDKQFDDAYNISLVNNDLPYVRWGRIDYLNVTALTTKWMVWKAPVYVVSHNRGRTLRFYQPGQIRASPEILHRFLKEEGWKETEPWSGPFAPGGVFESTIDSVSVYGTLFYNYLNLVPKWMLLVLSGALASVIVNFFHRKQTAASAAQPRRKLVRSGNRVAPATPAPANTTPVAPSPPASTSTTNTPKKRKNGKS
jgi:hypothetical protein